MSKNRLYKYCVTCHMAYILIFSIFLPSLNNNTIFILYSYFIKHTLASFFKFLCICSTESLPGIYKPPELSQITQSSTCSCVDNTSSRLLSTSPPPGFPCPDEKAIPVVCLASDHRLADRKSALPCSVRAFKRHQTLIASQHCHLLDSIVFTLDWCSYCTPQAGILTNSYCMPQASTVTKSYCTPLVGTLTNSYCMPQAGTVTKSYCTPQAGTLTNSYCTPQAGTVTKSYCMPPAGTLVNSYCTPQAGTVTNSYCMPLAGTVTHSSSTPQAGTATN